MSRSTDAVNPRTQDSTTLPDPGRAATLDDLVERLRLLKVWAGNPSYQRITAEINTAWAAAGRPAAELAGKTTVVDCFRHGRRRLNVDLVAAVVQALHPDVGYVAQWRQALRVIGGEISAAAQVRVQDTLPPDIAEFTGRAAELDRLRQAVHHLGQPGGVMVVCAVEGMPGVGKTQLTVHAAHMLMRDNAFDRVLLVDLRGFHSGPAQPAVDPSAVLDGFLRLLGVPGQQIPHDLPARIAAYRDQLKNTRALVVLDNAADAAQALPLLPAVPGCLTLITSRRSLTDLHPTIRLVLDAFTAEEAMAFLTRALPQVADATDRADQDAAARIAARCGHLPLALGLIAGHIRGTPGWTLTDHADRLDERRRHRHLESGVEMAIDLSYRHLPAGRQRLLRLLALHPGHNLDAHAAAALADIDLPTAHDHLHRLCHDHLLQQAALDRYSFHDLVRAYAASRASDHDPPPQRRTAQTRLLDYLLYTATTAAEMAYPQLRQRQPAVPHAAIHTPDLADRNRASHWLDIELTNLLATAQHAAEHGWPEHIWQMSTILDRHLITRGRYRDAQTLHQQALHLARHHRNRPAEMTVLNILGGIHRILGRYEQATDDYGRALQIAHNIGDRIGEMHALTGLGQVHWMQDRYEQADDHYLRALQIAHHIGERIAQGGLSALHQLLGHHDDAADRYERTLQIAQDIGDRDSELSTLIGLGRTYWMKGSYQQADQRYNRALQIAQDIGDRSRELAALIGLGHVRRMLGRYRPAADCFQQALTLARELDSSNWQYEALQGIGRVHHAIGHPEHALIHHQQALQHATDLAQPADQARAHDGLAHAHQALNQHEQARQHWRHALDILTCIGATHTDDNQTTIPNIRGHLTDLNL